MSTLTETRQEDMHMKKMILSIDGMACSMCESHVNDALRQAFPGIRKVSSSHSKGETVIQADASIPEAELHRVLDPTGYKLLSVTETEEEEKSGFFSKLFHK